MDIRWIRVVECGGQGPRRVDLRGKEVMHCAETTWTNRADKLIDFAYSELLKGTDAVIFSVAGMIKDHSQIITCPNVHLLDGILLGSRATRPPAFVCNDMEASITGMAEMHPDLKYFMGITRSTGIGVRIWKNGKILSESEAGHMCVDTSPFAPICGCGRRGCAEAFIGGNAITKFVVAEMDLQGRQIPTGIHPCEWLDICYNKEEAWAVRHYQEIVIPCMARFLANMQLLVHVPAIVWKGTLGLRSFKDIPGLQHRVQTQMRAMLPDPAWADISFHLLDCPKDHEAYIGAAKIALDLLSK